MCLTKKCSKDGSRFGLKLTIQILSVSADYCFGTDPLVLQNLSKVNFIFAPNGSGKTTISNALADQPTSSTARSSWPTAATTFPIRVFNERYRDQVLRERVDGIFTMGGASSDAPEKIDELEAARKQRKKEREAWESQIGRIGDKETRSGLLGELTREEDAVRESVYAEYRKIDSAISEVVFKGFQRNKEKIMGETLRRHALSTTEIEKATWESLKARIATISGDVGTRDRMPNTTVSTIIQEAEIQDLSSAASNSAGNTLSALIQRLSNEDWVSEGRQYLDDADSCCPFCQQELPPDFEKNLQEHFANGFDAQLQRAREIHENVLARTKNLSAELATVKSFIANETSEAKTKVLKLIETVEAACELVAKLVDEKVSHPTSHIEVSDVSGVVRDLQDEVDSFNEQVDEHNRLVSNAKSEKKKIVEEGWKLFLSDKAVAGAISRYEAITLQKTADIDALRDQISTSEALDSADEAELVILREQVSNTQEVADRINRTLKAMGFHRFRVEAEGHVAGGYRIVRPDGSFAHRSLSEGEKSFLCFVYFWESLFGANESGSEPEDLIAVFDDPISSLDSETLFLVAAHIRQAATWAITGEKNLRQLIVLTHNTQFHHEAAYVTDRSSRDQRHYFRLLKQVDGITVAKDDGISSKIRGSYPLLWDSVVEAANSDEDSSLIRVGVFNIVRRIVENYFRTIGQVKDYQSPQGLAAFEERVIMMFHIWASSGSHTIAEDIDQTIDVGGTHQFLRLFRRYFDLQGHSAHFDMMLQASNGESLATPGGVFAPWPNEEFGTAPAVAS